MTGNAEDLIRELRNRFLKDQTQKGLENILIGDEFQRLMDLLGENLDVKRQRLIHLAKHFADNYISSEDLATVFEAQYRCPQGHPSQKEYRIDDILLVPDEQLRLFEQGLTRFDAPYLPFGCDSCGEISELVKSALAFKPINDENTGLAREIRIREKTAGRMWEKILANIIFGETNNGANDLYGLRIVTRRAISHIMADKKVNRKRALNMQIADVRRVERYVSSSNHWVFLPQFTDDFYRNPKPVIGHDGKTVFYRSLHMTVDLKGTRIDIQIRTPEDERLILKNKDLSQDTYEERQRNARVWLAEKIGLPDMYQYALNFARDIYNEQRNGNGTKRSG